MKTVWFATSVSLTVIGIMWIEKGEIHTVSSAQYRFVATIPVGPLFSQPHTYKPSSRTAVSEVSLNTRPLSFGTIPERYPSYILTMSYCQMTHLDTPKHHAC